MKRPFFLLSILWSVVIAVLSLASPPSIPEVEIDYLDKIGHFFVYAILAFLIYKASIEAKYRAPIVVAFLIPLLFGILMEFLQGLTSGLRVADKFDAIANGLGALFVCFVLFLRR